MAGLDVLEQRQVDIGAAQWFRPEPTSPPSNQIIVRKGVISIPGKGIIDKFTSGDQTTAAFAVVSAGHERWDLVYLNSSGVVTILQGTAQVTGGPQFTGAPGFTGGPDLPDNAVPVAIIHITEQAGVIVSATDIFQVDSFINLHRALKGHRVSFGNLGVAPTGSSDVVTGIFAAETSSNGTVRGVVTSAPNNDVLLLDERGRPVFHAAEGSQIFGRLTFGGGIWTLTYKYVDLTNTEQTVTAIETDCVHTPTNLQLIGVQKVFSENESTRPIFDSSVAKSVAFQVDVVSPFGGDGSDGAGLFNAPTNLSGVKNYTTFTNNSTVTVPAGGTENPNNLTVKTRGDFTNNGTITANSAGLLGGIPPVGGPIVDFSVGQSGGAAGGGAGGSGWANPNHPLGYFGGASALTQVPANDGGAGGSNGAAAVGGNGALPTFFSNGGGSLLPGCGGGVGGRANTGGTPGGKGGGVIDVECNGNLTEGTITSNGANGVNGVLEGGGDESGGSGGGGGGSIRLRWTGTRTVGTVTATGGTGGTAGGANSRAGGNGANGIVRREHVNP